MIRNILQRLSYQSCIGAAGKPFSVGCRAFAAAARPSDLKDSKFKVKTCNKELIELDGEFEGGSSWTLRYDIRNIWQKHQQLLSGPSNDGELFKLVSSMKCILETKSQEEHDLLVFGYTGTLDSPSLSVRSFAHLFDFMKETHEYLMTAENEDENFQKEVEFVERTFEIVQDVDDAKSLGEWKNSSAKSLLTRGVDKTLYQVMDCIKKLSSQTFSS